MHEKDTQREQDQGSEEQKRAAREGAGDREWDEGIGRGEEYGHEGERERAQGDVYGQEQERSAGPRGPQEREAPPQGWYGQQRPPRPENFPRGSRSGQRGEKHQSSEGGYEQGHRGGYEKGYRGSQSGYEQDYEQFRGEPGRGPTYGGPGYEGQGGRRREERSGGRRGEGDVGPTGWTTPGTPREQGGHRGRAPKNYTRSDARIQEEISERLMESDDVDPSEVEVHVEHGEVILRGTAHSKEEKRRIEDIAEDVLGVEEVLNHLRIRRRDESGQEEWNREPSAPRGPEGGIGPSRS